MQLIEIQTNHSKKAHRKNKRKNKAIECNDTDNFQAEYKLQRISIGIQMH